MSEAAQTADPDEAMLDELARLALSAARMAHERMAAAQDDHAFNDAGRTLQRMSRSLRQTLALKAKLRRDAAERTRAAREDAARDREGRLEAHKAAVKAAVERVLWDEHEADDYAELHLVELEGRLEGAALADDFLDTPVAVHVARLRAEMDLPPGPEALTEPPIDPAPRRSSG